MCSLWIVYYKHKFIIAIHFSLLLAVFTFILNKWFKYQLCYLKRCLYTQKFYLFIVSIFFLLLLVLFLCLLKIVYYCLDEFVVFLCIVHVWFWFFILLPRFFPRTKIMFQSAFFLRYKNVASKSFNLLKRHLAGIFCGYRPWLRGFRITSYNGQIMGLLSDWWLILVNTLKSEAEVWGA